MKPGYEIVELFTDYIVTGMERFDHSLFPVTLESLDDDLFDIHCTH